MRGPAAGDLAALEAMLAADVVLYGDGGGKVKAATEPVVGAAAVARFVDEITRARRSLGTFDLALVTVNGRPGRVLRDAADRVWDVLSIEVVAGRIEAIRSDPGSLITLLADPENTGGLLTSNRSLMRAGSEGAPPHYHRRSAELFFVLNGRLTVLLDEDVVTLKQGDLLVVPPGMPHAFAPTADTDADILFVFTPGTARFEYFRLLDGAHRGEAGWELISETQDRFDNHYVESPIWREARDAA